MSATPVGDLMMHRTGASRTGLPVLSRRRSHNHQLPAGVPSGSHQPRRGYMLAQCLAYVVAGEMTKSVPEPPGAAAEPPVEAVQGREVARRVQFEHRAVTIGPAEGGRTIHVVLRIPGQGGRWSSPIRPREGVQDGLHAACDIQLKYHAMAQTETAIAACHGRAIEVTLVVPDQAAHRLAAVRSSRESV